MNYIARNDTALQPDIESGGGGFVHRDSRESPVPSAKQQAKMFIAKLYGTSVDPPENRVSFLTNSVDGNAPSVEKVEANEGKHDVEGKKAVKQKQKPASAKKPPRPPRPPKAPSLDAADKKLIREIAELARLKRARIERMKALRKTKACKASSSNGGSALGFLFTIIFGLLILLQGIPSRGRPADFHGSRVQGVAVDATNLASAQFLGYPPVAANNLNGPVSSSPNSLEQVTGLAPHEKPRYPR